MAVGQEGNEARFRESLAIDLDIERSTLLLLYILSTIPYYCITSYQVYQAHFCESLDIDLDMERSKVLLPRTMYTILYHNVSTRIKLYQPVCIAANLPSRRGQK